MTPEPIKEIVYQDAIKLVDASGVRLDVEGKGLCVPWMLAGYVALLKHGFNPCFQAGTALWPMIDMSKDDGVSATHFSYTWDPGHALSQLARKVGRLAEVHAWLGLVEQQELVDFSTSNLKEQAQDLGLPWTGPAMPKFIWSSRQNLPEHVRYQANADATFYTIECLKRDPTHGIRWLRWQVREAQKKVEQPIHVL